MCVKSGTYVEPVLSNSPIRSGYKTQCVKPFFLSKLFPMDKIFFIHSSRNAQYWTSIHILVGKGSSVPQSPTQNILPIHTCLPI